MPLRGLKGGKKDHARRHTSTHTHTLVRIHTIANTYATKPWNTGKIKSNRLHTDTQRRRQDETTNMCCIVKVVGSTTGTHVRMQAV